MAELSKMSNFGQLIRAWELFWDRGFGGGGLAPPAPPLSDAAASSAQKNRRQAFTPQNLRTG